MIEQKRKGGKITAVKQPRKAPVILGLGVIGMSYWLMYSARANWGYEGNVVNWSRYHLLPQLGLAMLLAGGWPAMRSANMSVVDGLRRVV